MVAPLSIAVAALVRDGLVLLVHRHPSRRWYPDSWEPVNAAPEEHDDLRWFRPSDLADMKMAHPESLPSILSALQGATD